MDEPILREGHNAWCKPRARRAALLIDGSAYYAALASAFERAERSILMIGWDFHSQVRLGRDGSEGAESSALVELLQRAVRRKRSLRVRILAWDFSLLYTFERELLPTLRFEFSTHRRIRFLFDDRHPLGASQHQKLVLVDDALAFSGGLDITACRWDTREHRPNDPRRCDPGFPDYAPFHDVQMVVDGEAALALAELGWERWRRAGGRMPRRRTGKGDPWPRGLVPDFSEVSVGISRTQPAYEDRDEVREVEALHLDSIRAARHTIYLENQYLSSPTLGDALAARLEEADGPEVVIVLPASLSGWLEEHTMGVMLMRIAKKLLEADRHGRLALLRPRLPGGARLTIHSKVAVIDDRLLRVGSANLSNRSMGFDSECDLSLESSATRDLSREILRARNDLVAEHLGCSVEQVSEAVDREGSLRAAIAALDEGERGLDALTLDAEEDTVEPFASTAALFDPEQPIEFDAFSNLFTGGRNLAPKSSDRRSSAIRLLIGAFVVAGLVAVWQWTPLAEWVSPEALSRHAAALSELGAGWGGLWVVLLVALASTLLVPVTALIAACGAVFGFSKGALIALAGSVLGAGIGYAAGASLWRDAVRRLAGRRLTSISQRLAERGVLAAAALRVIPIAPFGVVNLVAGASHIRARHFLLGTTLGMAPGTAALAWMGDRALDAMRDPSPRTIVLALAGVALLWAIGALAARWMDRRSDAEEP